jgi:hypothetical protein
MLYGMEGDIIHGVYKSLIFVIRNGIAPMAFERIIVPETLSNLGLKHEVEKISVPRILVLNIP